MRFLSLLFLGVAGLIFTSCAAQVDLSGTPVIRQDEWVRRHSPQIYIQPDSSPTKPLTVLLYPFGLPQEMQNAGHVEAGLSQVFQSAWFEEKAAPVVDLVYGKHWPGKDAALKHAKEVGADLVAGGDITHLLIGGTTGDTVMAVNLAVYDVHSGWLLWSMAHAGQIGPEFTRDYIFFKQESRMPLSPSTAVMHALACDMAEPFRDWNMKSVQESNDEAPSAMQKKDARDAMLSGTSDG
jgi:hypothetical protein